MLNILFRKYESLVRTLIAWVTAGLSFVALYGLAGAIGKGKEFWMILEFRIAVLVLYLAATILSLSAALFIRAALDLRAVRKAVSAGNGPVENSDELPAIIAPDGRVINSSMSAPEVLSILKGQPVRQEDHQWWLKARGRFGRAPYKADMSFAPVRLFLIGQCKQFENNPRVGDQIEW